MKSKQLRSLILQGECDCVEFKEIPCDGMYKTICAFLNTCGGFLLVGVSDHGDIVGFKPSLNDLEEFQATKLQWNSICLKEEIVRVDSRSIWLIVVRSLPASISTQQMATWNGDAYIRLGSSTQKARNCLHVRMPM
jgi:ATP-dependent DNA helicase RecG